MTPIMRKFWGAGRRLKPVPTGAGVGFTAFFYSNDDSSGQEMVFSRFIDTLGTIISIKNRKQRRGMALDGTF